MFEIFDSWNTLYLFPYIAGILLLHTLNTLSPMFLGINNNKFSFACFSNLSFFCVFFLTLKKKLFFKNIFSIDLILFQVKAL